MSYQQLVTPNPDISCRPGWCLEYVRSTFGLPVVEPTATAGWANAQYKHADWDFPDGVWVPLWFAIPGIPAGHVALRAPDGSVYSTSDASNVPHHHPSLQELIWYYGPRVQPEYQLELQYLGWSEDISGVRVVQEFSIQSESTAVSITKEEDMPLSDDDLNKIYNRVWFGGPGLPLIENRRTGNGAWPETYLGSFEARIQNEILAPALAALPAADVAQQLDAAGMARSVKDELVKLLEGK